MKGKECRNIRNLLVHGNRKTLNLFLHTQRQDLESLKRKDKRRKRATFGPSSHPLFLSGNTSCCWLSAVVHVFVAHERDDFSKRPMGSRQKSTQS